MEWKVKIQIFDYDQAIWELFKISILSKYQMFLWSMMDHGNSHI